MSACPIIVGLGKLLWDGYPDAAHFGGAPANFACHAASLGAESWMVSRGSSDELGERSVEKLRERERDVQCGHVRRHANAVASLVCSQKGATPVLPVELGEAALLK